MILEEFKKKVKEELMPEIGDYLAQDHVEDAYMICKHKNIQQLFLTLMLHCFPRRLAEVLGNEIPDSSFYAMPLPSHLSICPGIQYIGDLAFEDCKGAKDVILPDGLKSIGSRAFFGCSDIVNINIPASVTQLGKWVFRFCYNLTSISIPDGITSIPDSTFSGCTSLASVTLPDSVTHIGAYAFSNCEALTSLTIPEDATDINFGAFSGCPLLKIKIPKHLYYKGCYKAWDIKKSQVEWY